MKELTTQGEISHSSEPLEDQLDLRWLLDLACNPPAVYLFKKEDGSARKVLTHESEDLSFILQIHRKSWVQVTLLGKLS